MDVYLSLRMFNRILVPTDGSSTAAAAVHHALELATAFDSTLVGLYVVDVRVIEGPLLQTLTPLWGDVPAPSWQADITESLEERGREVLDTFAERARQADRPVETSLEIGIVPEVIVEKAKSADIVVLGRRGEHAEFGDQPVGATAHGVARRSAKPILVCPRGEVPLERPLVAYDGSDHACRALSLAVAYAERRHAPLHLVAVRSRREDAEALLDEAETFADGHDLAPVRHARESDHPSETILQVADEVAADLLVMGAYGKGRLREFLLGSTTEAILTRFPHPVLLYR